MQSTPIPLLQALQVGSRGEREREREVESAVAARARRCDVEKVKCAKMGGTVVDLRGGRWVGWALSCTTSLSGRCIKDGGLCAPADGTATKKNGRMGDKTSVVAAGGVG